MQIKKDQRAGKVLLDIYRNRQQVAERLNLVRDCEEADDERVESDEDSVALLSLSWSAEPPAEPLITEVMWFVAALVFAGLEWWLRRKRGMV